MADVSTPEGTSTRVVGRYDVLREVGRGGMAVVYLARQTDLDRSVALKELAALRAADPASPARFLLESRLAGSLNHPNVVTVHDYFESEGTPYISMEYFDRGSLRRFVGHVTLAQTAGVLEGLLAGLAHAESRGIVHRDLKPENVMVTGGGGVKISDFGLARALQQGGALTTTSTAVGTPAYMAPEQALGKDVGPWTDLYAVGVIAYELLSGRLPFEGSGLPLELVLQHLRKPVPPLRSVAPDVDPRLAAWVERMLSKDSRKRPASAARAWDELEEIVIGILGPRWHRDSRPLDDALDVPVREPPIVSTQRRSRRPLALALASVVGAGTIAAAAVLATTGGGRARDGLPSPSEQASLVASGAHLYVADPRGRIVELSASSLRKLGELRDPAHPRAVGSSSGRVYVADDAGVETLPARRFLRLPGATAIAGGTDAPVVVSTIRDKGGQLCELAIDGALRACLPLAFRPTGLGVSPTGMVFATDSLGYVQLFKPSAGRLVTAGAVAVGPKPHGMLVPSRGRVYVPIDRGIAVVDPLGRRLLRVIHLPVSPAAVWVSRFSGRLFAALYAIDRVARVDTTLADAKPAMLPGFGKPVAIWGTGGVAYVLNAADGTVCRLDALTGERLGPCRAALPHA